MKSILSLFVLVLSPVFSLAVYADAQLEGGRKAIESMQGCYLIDYSYTETEGLLPGYERDKRVYDVNKNQSVKEWIYAENISENKIRLQHILFSADLNGKVNEASMLKHQAEDWEYNAASLYNFVSPLHWELKALEPNLWTRKITNLDDGLRYQCASTWNLENAKNTWSCGDNFAPIPGRETRDMKRKDYNTLTRSTGIITYGTSWLERQENVKTIYKDGVKTPLAKELGKNWYVRLDDAECSQAKEFATKREKFWTLLREVWEMVLSGDKPFVEKLPQGAPPRYVKMMELEAEFADKDLNNNLMRLVAKRSILDIINAYRAE